MLVAKWALENFYEFLDDYSPFDDPDAGFKTSQIALWDHVADYVQLWIAYGHGAITCANDFGVSLTVLAMIADDSFREPERLPRTLLSLRADERLDVLPSVTKIFVDGCSICERVTDPQYFALLSHDPDYHIRMVEPAKDRN
ncbi:hypothetical protein ACWED2_04765 [Amycolatopsis sp. NPDC005003]